MDTTNKSSYSTMSKNSFFIVSFFVYIILKLNPQPNSTKLVALYYCFTKDIQMREFMYKNLSLIDEWQEMFKYHYLLFI